MKWFAYLSPFRHSAPSSSGCDVVAEARSRKSEAERTRGEVKVLTSSLDAHRRKNHFGESLEAAFRGVA